MSRRAKYGRVVCGACERVLQSGAWSRKLRPQEAGEIAAADGDEKARLLVEYLPLVTARGGAHIRSLDPSVPVEQSEIVLISCKCGRTYRVNSGQVALTCALGGSDLRLEERDDLDTPG